MTQAQSEDLLAIFRRKVEDKPITLEGWLEMFRRIYGNVNKLIHFSDVGFHFMEEVGEVARALRLEDPKELGNEIADIFAW